MNLNAENFTGRQAIRYLGQYKPMGPYGLPGGFLILPAESGMFPHWFGTLRQNVSYFVGPKMPDKEIMSHYRDWLIFDSFVLNDKHPIRNFDEGYSGDVKTVPPDLPPDAVYPDYKQIDYDDIAGVMFMTGTNEEGVGHFSYRELFETYRGLDPGDRDLIEWSVSAPHLSWMRFDAFFKVRYWQLFHWMILLERLLGESPTCSADPTQCAVCGRSSVPHSAILKRDWFQKVLTDRIKNSSIVNEYVRVIEKGTKIRNKFAHTPSFDRSVYATMGHLERQEYGADRAVAQYTADAYALDSLLMSLEEIARYLLLDKVFGTQYFRKILALNVMGVQG